MPKRDGLRVAARPEPVKERAGFAGIEPRSRAAETMLAGASAVAFSIRHDARWKGKCSSIAGVCRDHGRSSTEATALVQNREQSARLLGARMIVTGLSAAVADALVALAVDMSALDTIGDLQGGIEEAERVLGYPAAREVGRTPRRNGW